MKTRFTKSTLGFLLAAGLLTLSPWACRTSKDASASPAGFAEKKGIVSVEAENYHTQIQQEVRAWYNTSLYMAPFFDPDPDPAHAEGASNGAYLELLPDSRVTHDDKLIHGENFSNQAGQMAILSYRVYFRKTGKYYVWVRAYSTGSEDNGLHVGIDGTWPESGQRMQWCEGKHQWTWESKQRTQENHCGEPEKIFLEVREPGWHDIQFSMREDGFEFDKWVMSLKYEKPQGMGPPETKR